MPKAKAPRTTKPKAEKKLLQMPDNGNGANSSAPSNDLENTIRLRAYQLYEERGYVDGQADEDWFNAEREVLNRDAQKHSA